MPKNRLIIVIGVLIALLPVLGFPHSWESFFQIIAGLSIVILSVWVSIDKKLTLKAKAQQRLMKKAAAGDSEHPILDDDPSAFGKRITDFYPKTGQPGRRMSDLNPTIEESGN